MLLRSCLKYKYIENIGLKTKRDNISLKNFCDYCIHHSHCVYEDNRRADEDLEVYLLIDTDKKEEVAFVINKNIRQIRKIVVGMLETLSN